MKQQTKYECYLQVYRMHLQNNNLADDSDTITEKDLYRYVDEEIDQEDKVWYGLYWSNKEVG